MHFDEFVKFINSVEGKFKIWYIFKPLYEFINSVINIWNDNRIFFYFFL